MMVSKFRLRLGLAAIILSTNACSVNAVGFKSDIVPVLKSKCANCHLTGQEAGSMALTPKEAYKNLVNVKSTESALMRVKPGSPDQSYLILKLEGRHLDAGGTGAQMPFGQPPLDKATLQNIREWISTGALEN